MQSRLTKDALFLFFRKILLIRPKLTLADDDNYRERRYFTAWTKYKQIEDFYLPKFIQELTNQVFNLKLFNRQKA
jgi:hypothetical protein